MRLSLATRIFLGYAAVLATFGAVCLFSIREMHRNQVEIRLVSEGYLRLSQQTTLIKTFHQNLLDDVKRMRDETDAELIDAATLKQLIQLSRYSLPGVMGDKLKASAETAKAVQTFAPESEVSFLKNLVQKLNELEDRYSEYELLTEAYLKQLEINGPRHLQTQQVYDRLETLGHSLKDSIALLQVSLDSRILERVSVAQERERRTGVTIIALSVIAIAVGLLATAISARSLRPVATLIERASRIGRGDYSVPIGLRGDDEIATLAREFDAMAQSLQEREAQLKQKQAELLSSERLAAIGRVSAQVAHEVRNPLSSIGLNVEMLEEQLKQARFPSDNEQREAIELLTSVTQEVDRLTEVTEEYLRFSRHPVPALQPEDLHALIERVLDFSAQELSRANVVLVRSFAHEPITVVVDEGQLRQVLLNLVRNAREAMPQGGTLTVSTRTDGLVVEIAVADTGLGLSEEVRARLFEPFFSTKQSGTGLGLAISRQIVDAHHGSLSSPLTEGGAQFVISLPLPKAPGPSS